MARVLVSHPHATAVANACARALDEAAMLATYVTGIAVPERGAIARALRRLRPTVLANRIVGVPAARLRTLAATELGARAAAALSAGMVGTYEALFSTHDAAVALLPWPGDVDTVYAYEDGALRTFRRARRRGLRRIWDLPAPHYRSRERTWREEARRWPGTEGAPPLSDWKRQRKDDELRLATGIVVASRYALGTLREAGVEVPTEVVPYGFPVQDFQARTRAPEGPFTVLAVGTQSVAKGTPYLLEAWKRARLPSARLRLVGPLRLSSRLLADYGGAFEHVPPMPRSMLGDEYRRADVVVFSSLGDGFGLVVQEAMCCGVPVIGTPSSGAPECISDREDGLIVPAGDVDALVSALRDAAADRGSLWRMGLRARARAERWSWTEAGRALRAAVERLAC